MDYFIPDIYAQSIHTINYKKLKKSGIKCLLFDLDNTIAPIDSRDVTKKVKELFAYLEDIGFKVIIFSNSGKKRLKPFKENLNVDTSFSSRKPLKGKYKKIMELYHFKDTEIACVGDQLLTDIFGANRMGFTSILVNQLCPNDFFVTKFNRFFERIIFKKFEKRGIFYRGKYYD